jgi:NitT/TauT family transport system permease protein
MSATGQRRRTSNILRDKPEWFLIPGLFVIVVGTWEWLVRFLDVPVYVLPPPSKIFEVLLAGLRSGLYLDHAFYTLGEAMGGFLIASVAGLVLGSLVAQFSLVEKTLYPYLVAIQTTPKIAIAPLFIMWFGFGSLSKVTIAAIVAFFPILVNVIYGLKSTDTARVELMRSLRASTFRTFTMVRLPSALPMIFAGLNIGIVFSLLGAIVGEFVGSRNGLGNLVMQMNSNLDAAGVFAVLVVLSAIGVSLHLMMQYVQRRLLFWHESTAPHI